MVPSRKLIVLLSLQWSSHSTASGLRTLYDSIMNDMWSLATMELPTTRYGDFDVSILLEKLPEKLLINVLKEYANDNPTIGQLIEMIHNAVKKLG